jgi:3-isopropylmalate dehydrogenase
VGAERYLKTGEALPEDDFARASTPTKCAMFEPADAVPSASRNRYANPAAAILADALMLRHLGFAAKAGAVESAVAGAMQAVSAQPTPGGSLATREAAAAIEQRLG